MTYTNSPIIVQTTPAGLRYLAPIDDKNTVIAKESVNGNELDIMRLMVCWNAMIGVGNPDKLVGDAEKLRARVKELEDEVQALEGQEQ